MRRKYLTSDTEKFQNGKNFVRMTVDVVLPVKRSVRDKTGTPLKKTAYLAFDAGTRNVGFLREGVLDNGVVNASDMHFTVAGTDMNT